MKLIPQIKERRMEKHMTQKELADLIDMSKSQLSRLENGHIYPGVETLFKIALAIDCTVDSLYKVIESKVSG